MVFRFRFLRCAAAVLLLLGLVIAGSGSCLGGDRERTLTVGVLSYSPPGYDGAFIKETVDYLKWRLPQYRFETE